MATPSGTANTDVKQPVLSGAIRQTPWEFKFFQCVRWLQRIQTHRGYIGKFYPPSREVVRFHANPSPSFPPSELFKLEWPQEGAIHVTVNFMGLFGPMGVLPLYYTEYIMGRHRAKDTGVSAFLDIFNHRMISLFYQAWEKYRFYVAYERGERDRLSQYLLDLIGLGTVGLQNRQDVRDDSLLFYSGLLSLLPRSALGLQQILSDFFDVPIHVEQFVGAWYPLEKNSICRFNRADSYSEQLGVGAIVGDEVWDPQSGIRVRVGPLTLLQYLDFLPNGSGYKPLKALTTFFTNGEISFEMQLVLKREEVPSCELGALGDAGPRLGWVTWAKTAAMNRDPDETVLNI
ncbi:MAG TPA: type VI secretion system baseplate subunit TssG [Bryobacteraceae bacterium]|nr:type VI secretion system baseplate subunit TssG [Bryobacteraceae bacterium]